MSEMPDRHGSAKADRALKLYEQGISRTIIAERLGVRPSNINGMIQRAKQRRDNAKENA